MSENKTKNKRIERVNRLLKERKLDEALELAEVSDELIITTDDGSYGIKGFGSTVLQKLIDDGKQIDFVVAIGPTMMMKAVAEVTRPYKIETIASLNAIMIDGTGMSQPGQSPGRTARPSLTQ